MAERARRRGEHVHAGALAWRSGRVLHGLPACHTRAWRRHGRAPPAVPVGNEKGATRRGEHLHARDWGGWGTGEPRRRYIRRRGERGQVEEQVEQPLKNNFAIRRIH